ncbi:MAG: alkaline phosphatase family protein, partial [Thermodesulfobacteriota bacterium]
MAADNPASKVLLIGWDGADWKIIMPLLDQGFMPNLEKLVQGGVMGNLATLYPDLSPMLWTSIATGKRPFKHGVLGFTEPAPQKGGIRPVTNLSRRTKALWNIMSQTGRKSVVVGWWPSHPAEPINGVMVSNQYQRAVAPYGRPWPLAPFTIHPPRLIRNLARLRVHPQALDSGLISLFLPRLAEIDQEKDHRVESVAKILADATTIKQAAAAIMHHEPWDLAAVYFDGPDHFSHGFMAYHPPKLPWVQERDFELYHQVVTSGYRYHDFLLGALLAEAGEETTVILVSDHGFHSDHLRPRHIPREPAGPAAQHRHYGVFVIKGPGIKQDDRVYGAGLLDVCPTILAALGLPVGEDMDGKPLVNVFTHPPALRTIPSWDDVPGPDGRHPPDRQVDPIEAREAINQLVALGYIEKPPENQEKAAAEAVRELHFNLARSYMDAQRHPDAIPYLEELYEKWPDEYRFGVQLITCYQAIGRLDLIRPVLEELFRRKKKNMAEARKELRERRKKNKDRPAGERSRRERRAFRKLRAKAGWPAYTMEYLMGALLFAEGDSEGALVHLQKALKMDTGQPSLYLKTGDVFLKMKNWPEAEKCFRRTIELDPDSAPAHLGLGQSLLPRRRNTEAAQAALEAVGLVYHNPLAHYLLGTALHRQGRVPWAVEALKVAVSQNPNFPEAYRRLAYIYRRRLKDPAQAAQYRRLARASARRIKEIKENRVAPLEAAETKARTARTSDQVLLAAREIAPA